MICQPWSNALFTSLLSRGSTAVSVLMVSAEFCCFSYVLYLLFEGGEWCWWVFPYTGEGPSTRRFPAGTHARKSIQVNINCHYYTLVPGLNWKKYKLFSFVVTGYKFENHSYIEWWKCLLCKQQSLNQIWIWVDLHVYIFSVCLSCVIKVVKLF